MREETTDGTATERLVDAGPVPIAVRDLGGPGTPLLLLHGGGGNLATMGTLAAALRPSHRVVLADLRGHGRSGDGPWAWDAVLDDLDAVAAALDLDPPAVVGMSLGGMVAALWALRHPDCPGAVSLDGNPTPHHPDQLPGMDPAAATAALARLHEVFAGMAAAMAAPLTAEQLAAAVEAQRAAARGRGAPEEPWVEGLHRSLVPAGDGLWRLRPDPELVEQLRVAQQVLDLTPAYTGARCPLLLVLATEDLPEQRPFHELYAAYRRAVAAQVASALERNPNLHAVHLPGASHAMVAERPAEIAALVTNFLAGAGPLTGRASGP